MTFSKRMFRSWPYIASVLVIISVYLFFSGNVTIFQFPILAAGLLTVVFWRKCEIRRKKWIPVLALSALYSLFMVYGKLLDVPNGQSKLNSSKWLFLTWLGLTVFFFPLIDFLYRWISKLNEREVARELHGQKRELRIAFICIALAWGVIYLAMFPGMYGYDAPKELYYFLHNDVQTSFSPLYGLLFTGFTRLGKHFFDSYELGFGIFSALQMICNLMAIYQILKYLHNRHGRKALLFATIFYLLTPTNAIISVSSAQIALFIPCATMLTLNFLHMVEDQELYWSNKKNWMCYVFWGFLACTFRINGMYALVVATVLIFFMPKQIKKKMLLLNLLTIVLVYLYSNVFLAAILGKKTPSVSGMISIPAQQMAYVYNYSSDRLSKADKKCIEQYFSSFGLETYKSQPALADVLIREIKPGSTDNMKRFMRDWARIGRRDPDGYFKAFYIMDLGLFYPEKSYPDVRMWHPYIEYPCFDIQIDRFVTINRHSLIPEVDKQLCWLYGEHTMHGLEEPMAFSYIPIFSTLSKLGTYVWLVLLSVFYSFYAHKKESMVPIAFWIGYSATIVLAPVILYRYGAPLVFLAPLIVSMMFVKRLGDGR